jgi:hypothetical protein
MRVWLLVLMVGCSVERIDVDDDSCQLAEQTAICAQCFSGNITCSYDGVSETAASCGTCQAENALYQRLCDDGVDVVSGTVVCRGGPGAR